MLLPPVGVWESDGVHEWLLRERCPAETVEVLVRVRFLGGGVGGNVVVVGGMVVVVVVLALGGAVVVVAFGDNVVVVFGTVVVVVVVVVVVAVTLQYGKFVKPSRHFAQF